MNVWTPGLRDAQKRPVFVYFHGGGFDSQSADLIDGAALARRGDAVMVGVNHRLGGWGFLFLEDVGGSEFAGSANAGLQDLVLAGVNEALRAASAKVEAKAAQMQSELLGGLGLPGI